MMVYATLFLIGLHRTMLLILQTFPGAWGAITITALIFACLACGAGAPS
jgi:hypothetical protein